MTVTSYGFHVDTRNLIIAPARPSDDEAAAV
jgi:hypothetical protein